MIGFLSYQDMQAEYSDVIFNANRIDIQDHRNLITITECLSQLRRSSASSRDVAPYTVVAHQRCTLLADLLSRRAGSIRRVHSVMHGTFPRVIKSDSARNVEKRHFFFHSRVRSFYLLLHSICTTETFLQSANKNNRASRNT